MAVIDYPLVLIVNRRLERASAMNGFAGEYRWDAFTNVIVVLQAGKPGGPAGTVYIPLFATILAAIWGLGNEFQSSFLLLTGSM